MLSFNQILQDRYRIVRQLGHGGMGAVYEAIDERFGEPIALKEIIIDLSDPVRKSSILKAFEREAKALAKASHESIPFVRDYFSESDNRFLVMELVTGSDLAELLAARRTPFPIEDVLKWLDQILDALDYLHTLEPPIIHRDIKPQNLKLTTRRKIKLLDFGIAKSIDPGATETSGTFAGATLEYSPIEQILPVINPTFKEFITLQHPAKVERILAQNTDVRCDLYSLGATFYHLLTNKTPVEATKRVLDVWAGNPDPLPTPQSLNPAVSQRLSDYILKAMAVERDDRFSSALEMRQVLQADFQNIFAFNHNLEFQTSAAPNLPPPDMQGIPQTKPELVNLQFNDLSKAATTSSGSFKDNYAVAFQPAKTERIVPSAKRRSKLLWLLPALVLIVLVFGGIGAMLRRDNSAAEPANQPAVNSNQSAVNIAAPAPSSEPPAVPDSLPAAEPDSLASSTAATPAPKRATPVSETESPAEEITLKKKDTPEITAKPAPEKLVNAPPKKPTASPTKKPSADPNCVFTNSCKQ